MSQPVPQSARPIELEFELMDVVDDAIHEMSGPDATRSSIAYSYAFAIKQDVPMPEIARLNARIIEKWGMDDLTLIKKAAWSLCEGRNADITEAFFERSTKSRKRRGRRSKRRRETAAAAVNTTTTIDAPLPQ